MRNLVFFLVCGVVLAQGPGRVGVGVREKKLTLAETLRMALDSNLEIEMERTSVATAQEAVKAARGAFDGIFRWQPSFESRAIPTASPLLGADGKLEEDVVGQNFQFTQRMPWHGATFVAGFDNTRQTTTNPFTGLTPFYNTRLLLQYQQPLFRNRATDAARTEIVIRSRNTEISEIELELKAVDVITRAEMAYWDLAAARQDVEVKADGVKWGREQLERTQRMIESGTLAAVELAAAEAELERRVDTYHAAVAVVTEAENALKLLVASGRGAELWGDAVVPVEERVVDFAGVDDLGAAMAVALEKRPELRQVGLRGRVNEAQKELAGNQLKPQMNLTAAYMTHGLAGSAQAGDNPFSKSSALSTARINELSRLNGLAPLPVVSFGQTPAGLLGGYGSSLGNLFGGNFPTVQVGISLDWNTRNRTAEAQLSQAVIGEKRLRLERERVEQAIGAQVRNAMQALETSRQRIRAAEASARAGREKLESEVRLFQNGESTNFLVLTRQNEYSDSRRRVVVSRLDYNKAVARLRQAMGTTLEGNGLRVR